MTGFFIYMAETIDNVEVRLDPIREVVTGPLGITPELQHELNKLPEHPTQTQAKEAIEKATHQVERKLKGKVKTYKEIFDAQLPKFEEQGWYSVANGKYTPQLNQAILFVVDQRQNGGEAKVRHGFVSKIGFDTAKSEWYVEAIALRVSNPKMREQFINGIAGEVILWRPMPELPRLPKPFSESK